MASLSVGCVNGVVNLFGGRLELHAETVFRNQLRRVGTDDVRTETTICWSTSNLTKPSGWLEATALPDAWKGNLPTLYATPSSLSCFSVLPIEATCGRR